MADILSTKGYATMAVVSNYGYLSHDYGMDKGFIYFDNRKPDIERAIRSVASSIMHKETFEKMTQSPEHKKIHDESVTFMESHPIPKIFEVVYG